jgi:hypothetical protein
MSTRTQVVAFGVALLAVIVVGVAAVLVVSDVTRPVPELPSLADDPDPTLQGTVAYFDASSECVRIIAAAGGPSTEVLCLPPLDPSEAKALGKPIGPQLVWRADGRLEVTMFRMIDPRESGPGYRAGWQQVVDVRTGEVTDTPAAQVPSSPDLTTRPVLSPAGERISFTSSSDSGRVTISVTDSAGTTRTVFDEQGPGKNAYGLHSAFWSPEFQWVVADDGRILIITLDDPPVARVLADPDSVFGDEPRHASFAVTAEDLLSTPG